MGRIERSRAELIGFEERKRDVSFAQPLQICG